MEDELLPHEAEAWHAQLEQVFERLEDERQTRSEGLRGAANQIGDLAWSLDDQLAEVNYAEAVETMETVHAALRGTDLALAELVLLTWVRDGGNDEHVAELDLPEAPELDPRDLFVDSELVDSDDEDDTAWLANERVGRVARHIVRSLRAVEDALDVAIRAAESGDADAAGKAHDHAMELARRSQEGFDLWCETLEGVLAQTGHYPGLGGEYVDEFMKWLRQQRPPTAP